MKSNLELKLSRNKNNEFRKYPRPKTDLGTLVELNLNSNNSQDIDILKGLIIDSSIGGCGIIVVTEKVDLFKNNNPCYIKFTQESTISIKTRIVWKKKIDNNAFRLGLEYID